MTYSYIKFADKTLANKKQKGKAKAIIEKTVNLIASTFISKANPDFDSLINNVTEWLLEINNDDKLPNREIGIDKYGQVLFIMPWHNNYGYWTDNQIGLDYFKSHFKAVTIDIYEFENKWNEFINNNSLPEGYQFDRRGNSKYYRYLEQNGWAIDGFLTFTKNNYRILFDTSEVFYIEEIGNSERKEFLCKNMRYFEKVIETNTQK